MFFLIKKQPMNTKQHTPTTRSAFFRFYEELNDFLAEEQRKKTFPYEFTGKPFIRDTIEAIGVPHTEIDLILVDGESVGFNYQMRGGERVSVYPVFESLDITPLVHLRSKPLRKTRFVVDVHLGKLAHKLRLLGFDTLFRNDFNNSEIVELSLQEKLKQKVDHWQQRALRMSGGSRLGYQGKKDSETIGLLHKPGIEKWDEFTCLNSLRDVEPTSFLIWVAQLCGGDSMSLWLYSCRVSTCWIYQKPVFDS